MEQRRLELHELLCNLIGFTDQEDKHCYFSPPTGKQLKYPCIVYKLADIESDYADNISYLNTMRYEVTLIDEDPDSEFVKKILALPLCRFSAFFTSDGLNHFVFSLYY